MHKPEYVSVKFLSDHLCLSPASIWNGVKNGTLPAPYKIGPNSTRWRLSEVEEHIKNNNTKKRAPK